MDKTEALPSELSDDQLRQFWRKEGGAFHGPNVETGTMPESILLSMLRRILCASPVLAPTRETAPALSDEAIHALWDQIGKAWLTEGGNPYLAFARAVLKAQADREQRPAALSEAPPPCWYIEYSNHGQVTLRKEEADSAIANGAIRVTAYDHAASQISASADHDETPAESDILNAVTHYVDACEANGEEPGPESDAATEKSWASLVSVVRAALPASGADREQRPAALSEAIVAYEWPSGGLYRFPIDPLSDPRLAGQEKALVYASCQQNSSSAPTISGSTPSSSPAGTSATCVSASTSTANPLEKLRQQILSIPTRVEMLGGQRTTYVQLDEVLGWIDSGGKA